MSTPVVPWIFLPGLEQIIESIGFGVSSGDYSMESGVMLSISDCHLCFSLAHNPMNGVHGLSVPFDRFFIDTASNAFHSLFYTLCYGKHNKDACISFSFALITHVYIYIYIIF